MNRRPLGEEEPVPTVSLPTPDAPSAVEVRAFDPVVLDYKIKRAGTFGGLSVAGVLYVVGVVVVLKVMSIWPFDCAPITEMSDALIRVIGCAAPRQGDEGWQGVAGVMLTLFSVPTVLLIAVLRSASPKSDPLPDSVYSAVSDRLVTSLERLINAKR